MRSIGLVFSFTGLLSLTAACSSSSDQGSVDIGADSTSSGANSGAGTGNPSSGQPGSNGAGVNPPLDDTSILVVPPPATNPSTGTATGAGSLEDSCDGVDNDGNGIIDDVDVGHDGICDCLLIATIGEAGTWGNGDIFASWLSSRSASGAVDLTQTSLTAETLAPYHVIVAQDLRNRSYSSDEVAALTQWVENGGGLLTLIGYGDPSERVNVNELLSPFDLGYADQPILQRQNGVTFPITGWNVHPVTDGVDRVGADNGYPVTGGAQTQVLAFEQGHDAGRATEYGLGHVVVWGDEWITYDSEWSEHPDYQVELFWVNAIKWLTRADSCQVSIPDTIPRSTVR